MCLNWMNLFFSNQCNIFQSFVIMDFFLIIRDLRPFVWCVTVLYLKNCDFDLKGNLQSALCRDIVINLNNDFIVAKYLSFRRRKSFHTKGPNDCLLLFLTIITLVLEASYVANLNCKSEIILTIFCKCGYS